MAMQPKNYHAGGGDKWVVGGELVIEAGATVSGLTPSDGGLPEGGTNGQVLKIVDGDPAWAADTNTTYTAMSAGEATAGTATTARTITAAVLAGAIAERLPETSVSAVADTVPVRKADGRVETGTAVDGADAVNLTQMNAALQGQPASNITSGAFADARIPSLNASKTTAGVFDAARLPTGAAVADATDEASAVTQLNALLASLRTAGYIAA